MTKTKAATLGAASLFGLALLIGPGAPLTAQAATQSAATPIVATPIKGKIVNVTLERDCIDAAGTPVCTYDIAGIGVSDRGELIERTIVGSEHGSAATPGEVAPNRSYAVWTYPDGATMVLKSNGTGAMKADGQHVFAGTQSCIAGSGRYANVDCTIDWQLAAQPNGLYAGSYSGTVTPKSQS